MDKLLLINQLSAETEIPIHTIRYYEQFGLIKGKKKSAVKTNNYTYYDDEVVGKLRLINSAKELGFTLAEIKELIDVWYSKKISAENKIAVLNKKVETIKERIARLKGIKKQLKQMIDVIKKGNC